MRSLTQEKMFGLMEQKRVDQNVKSFCAENNIAEASYYYWRKKFRMQNDTSVYSVDVTPSFRRMVTPCKRIKKRKSCLWILKIRIDAIHKLFLLSA